MKKVLLFLFFIMSFVSAFAHHPDSVFVKGYTTGKNDNKNGLHIAYSFDGKNWISIGNEFSFLRSDYGRWGSSKKMYDPVLVKNSSTEWACYFFTEAEHKVVGVATTSDLVLWKPQDYFLYEEVKKKFPAINKALSNATVVYKQPWSFVQALINHTDLEAYRNMQYSVTAQSFAEKNPSLKPVNVSLNVHMDRKKTISDKLVGVFFEDLNYAADGGLYAELIQNRDFEYSSKDRREWNSTTNWINKNGKLIIETAQPVSKNNPHYAVLQSGDEIVNNGFDGIAVTAGEKYDLSLFARSVNKGSLSVVLTDSNGNKISNEITIAANAANWKQYKAVLIANTSFKHARLSVTAKKNETAVDLISLFPQKTFKNRKNGLRADLAQAIADIKPRFMRFPGGCLAHGNGLDNIYQWKNSIGKLEERKPDFNLWGYHQTMGLGYYEYFQFCEDIGAEPLPVLAAGVPCQNSSHHHQTGIAGQQGGIPLNEMDAYIQDILDLIEWANADKSTTWGKLRAAAGHPAPFNLKYIGIGNEDLISEVFKERFAMIYKAIKAKYPDMIVIGTVGPFYEGSDYSFGWDFASAMGVPMVDEHYYVPPAWLINNQDYYDKYDRTKPKVYLGEYAAHVRGRPNNMETALAEALYLCSVERNGDVVEMTSYAPLLAKEGHTQWNPDMIYFNNSELKPTPGYEVQKMFGNNAGEEYIESSVTVDHGNADVQKRIATSIVKDVKTGDLIIKLVNLLPVEATVDFKDLQLGNYQIEKTVLQGNPDDKNSKPVVTKEAVQNNKLLLPKYSFTVLRIKMK
ncbi:alpha-L-arabinofuranosidase [Lacibacter luteus]|uniref:non-reducing end alpha-L-arabinofuranosidase n=1 Tax=Lacibacter luteus TaxID=2508719 RepID=A0A4Q1CNP7_9BACT|nr:alpha-L-arabinofuranosidase C-terminal domain-containing protein [Lacibacter luteus]RXK62239.1 alpha-L-arabinofuranosidase [Lacibacter luteus]